MYMAYEIGADIKGMIQGWGVQKQPMKGNFVAQDLDLTLSPPPTEGFIPVHHA